MENPFAELTYRIASGAASAYNSCEKVFSKKSQKPKARTERSMERLAGAMADTTLNDDSESSEWCEELIRDGQNHDESKHHALIEGYAGEDSDWVLVGQRRASHEPVHSVNPAKERHELDLGAPNGTETPVSGQGTKRNRLPEPGDVEPCRRKKLNRYISSIDRTITPGVNQQPRNKNCPRDAQDSRVRLRTRSSSAIDEEPVRVSAKHSQDPEDIEPNDCNSKRALYPDPEVNRLMNKSDEDILDEMDELIAHIAKLTMRKSQAAVDGEGCKGPEKRTSGSKEATTDLAELRTSVSVSKGAAAVSNPPSPSPLPLLLPFIKTSVFSLLKKSLKDRVQQWWKHFLKNPANRPCDQQAEKASPARTRFEEPYRYYTLGKHK